MLDKPDFDENGIKTIALSSEKQSNMMMDIMVYRIKKGKSINLYKEEMETAALLTEGKVEFKWEEKIETASRKDVFSQPPYCLHICRGIHALVTAVEDSEIIVQSAENEAIFPSHFYTPFECIREDAGADIWEGTARREILTIFDYNNAPYSNLVIGEVITKPGRWSSYVPHSHEQPEVYYYKFDKPQGFGASFIGDEVYKIIDGSAAYISGGLTHPQATAPGYTMYYCWMIRNLKDNPWTSRVIAPEHEWLIK